MYAVPEVFTALDLEFTQPEQDILQVGWVCGRLSTGEILARGSMITKPPSPVSDYIRNLTGISQEMVDTQGVHVALAYRALAEDHRRYDAFRNMLTWGGGDTEALYAEVFPGIDKEGNAGWVGGRRVIDVKTVYISWRLAHGELFAGGLAKSMTKLGLAFEGRKHSAGDDALNTFRVYRTLLGLMASGRREGSISLPGGVSEQL